MANPLKISVKKTKLFYTVFYIVFSLFPLPFMLIWNHFLFIIFTAVLLVVNLIQSIEVNQEIDSNVETLISYYPELDDEMIGLNDADYIDENLNLLIYGDHLIAYGNFQQIDLRDCAYMYTSVSPRDKLFVGFIEYVTVEGFRDSFRFPISEEPSVNRLYNYITTYYDIDIMDEESAWNRQNQSMVKK